jgi:hypothetical protein
MMTMRNITLSVLIGIVLIGCKDTHVHDFAEQYDDAQNENICSIHNYEMNKQGVRIIYGLLRRNYTYIGNEITDIPDIIKPKRYIFRIVGNLSWEAALFQYRMNIFMHVRNVIKFVIGCMLKKYKLQNTLTIPPCFVSAFRLWYPSSP